MKFLLVLCCDGRKRRRKQRGRYWRIELLNASASICMLARVLFWRIYICYSTCCYESKCRLCASHLNLRMSSEKIFAKFAKYQKPSLPENIRQLYFVYHFFSSDLSFYRNYFHLFQQLFSFAIEGAVSKRNPQQYSIICIHQLL